MAGFLSQFVNCCCCYSDVHTKCTTTKKMKAYSWFSNKHKSEFILFSILCTICLFIGFEAVTKFKLRKERQSSLILYSREYEPVSFKDTIYTKLALMPWIDGNLGHTLSVLTQIGNIIAKMFWKQFYFPLCYRFPP